MMPKLVLILLRKHSIYTIMTTYMNKALFKVTLIS
jgi:hypothetical protein